MSEICRHCRREIQYRLGVGWRHRVTGSVYCGLDGVQRATPRPRPVEE